MIGILDYGLGNVLAFVNMYKRLHHPARVVAAEADLAGVTKLILPGVGAFDHAMVLFNQSGLRPPVEELIFQKQVPVLGVCVGMQMLADSSEEGKLPGLGWIKGRVIRVAGASAGGRVRLPHMGWNDIGVSRSSALFRDLDAEARFYFLHSYFFSTEREEDVLATVEYGARFTCAVGHGQVMGVQFHPEKSHRFGARLLQNFAES
jgi:glutamine amidotransferase